MIGYQKKDNGQVNTFRNNSTGSKKRADVADGSDMIIDPELGRFLGEEFLPEKHKEDEIRLLNSSFPQRPSLK